MPWQLLFAPVFIYPYVWAALIAAAFVWLVFGIFKSEGKYWSNLIIPISFLTVLTAPVWLEGLVQEIQCQSAGLRLNERVHDSAATLYWESFYPNPNAYSLGKLETNSPMGSVIMNELVRAVSEGRLRSFDIPYKPRRNGEPDSERFFQRFYLAPADGSMGECVRNFPQSTHFAPSTCLAFVESQGIQAAYELKSVGHKVVITHRMSGRTLGEDKFVELDRSETALIRVGLRKLHAWSCTTDAKRKDLAEGLVHLVFGSPSAPAVEVADLATYRRGDWSPMPHPLRGEPIPQGMAGIEYWIAKGAVRKMGQEDFALWQSATRDKTWTRVPDKTYLIIGDINRLPDGLAGGHSVNWVLQKGRTIPPGPIGHSSFYSLDGGCVVAVPDCHR